MRARLFVALALGAAAAACAGTERPEAGPTAAFGETIVRPQIDALLLIGFDADRDGRITPEEASAGTLASVGRFDENGDGSLGALELQEFGLRAGGAREAAPLLALADRNGDGLAGPGEVAAYFEGRVRRLDANADGGVDQAELMERITPRPRRTEREIPRRPPPRR